MRSIVSRKACLLLMLLCIVSAAAAEVPEVINYQGRLADEFGAPVPNGPYEITFTIYDAPADGQELWTSYPRTVTVEEGSFTYQLGFAESLPDDLFTAGLDRYLGITVGQDDELVPRTRLTSVPYAIKARRADTADVALSGSSGISGSGTANYVAKFTSPSAIGNSVVYETSGGALGIGLTNAMARLHIHHPEAGIRLTNENTGADWNNGLQLSPWTTNSVNFVLWNRANGFLSLGTNNQERMRITADGKIGIGTSSPYSILDIRGSSVNDGALLQLGNSDTSHVLRMWSGRSGDPNPFISWRFGDPLRFATDQGGFSEKMRITSGGSVGIGTTNPAEVLDVNGAIRVGTTSNTNAGAMRFTGTDFEGHDGSSWKSLTGGGGAGDGDWTVAGSNMYSGVVGNVGINTTSPGAKLEVNGNNLAIRASKSPPANPTQYYIEMRYDSLYGPLMEGFDNDLRMLTLDAGPIYDAGMIKLGLFGDAVDIEGSLNVGGGTSIGGSLGVFGGNITCADEIHADSLIKSGTSLIMDGINHEFRTTIGEMYLGSDGSYGQFNSVKVGIGTITPQQTLDVAGNASIQGALGMNSYRIVNVANPVNSQDAATKYYTDSVGALGDSDWQISGQDVITGHGGDYPSGNVGIGVASPGNKLDVSGDIRVRGGDLADLGGTSRVTLTDDGATELNDYGGTARVTVATNGNVGISEQTPVYTLEVGGDIGMNDTLFHNGDDDTYIYYSSDQIDLYAGGAQLITADEGTQDKVIVNEGGGDVDFRVESDGDENALVVTGSSGRVGIGKVSANYLLDVDGSIAASDTVYHSGDNDTYLAFSNDRLDIRAGNVQAATAYHSAVSQDYVVFNNGGGDVDFRVESDTSTHALFVNGNNGYVGIGTSSPNEKLDVAGTTRTAVLEIYGGSDLAEPFVVSHAEEVLPGMVVVIDENNPGQLRQSDEAYDRRVAGVISGAGGISPGLTLRQQGIFDDGQNVALTGRVWCWADASYGSIEPGDRLTTSPTPGHAMKATDNTRAAGAVIGKAMTPLTDGRELVLVLVQPQ